MSKAQAHPYFRLMRLHQPVGAWLLFWPCAWALALGSHGRPPLLALAFFATGALIMRAAGCIINDLTDRKFDVKVERTRTRPLASGETSAKEALLLLGALLACALVVAWVLGPRVLIWSLAAMPLVIAYPWMKRITWWPQLFLGLTFNWGALAGWVYVHGAPEVPAVLLYLAGIFWTLGYDTIYAHQDKEDDALIGVKSTALKLGAQTRRWLCLFYALCTICLSLAAMLQDAQALCYAILLLVAADFSCQIRRLNLDDRASALRIFRQNARTGSLIFLAFLLM